MMATEPTFEKPVDSHAPSDPQLTTSAESESPSHDVHPSQSPVNGGPTIDDIENKRVTSVEDRIHSVDGSVSGGSDTDASKTKDGNGHSRTSSVKKPTTFKAVSVNKTFLSAKGASSPSTAKIGDKPSTMASLTAQTSTSTFSTTRPRLIAKTGTGSRDSIPKFAVNGGRPATAPDPNAVWNKNRPVPAPDPKKLTDEELKKYGIHMATRLHSENIQGQSNWADIDDDDDDWAPETVTWADGTKVTLPQADEASTNAPDPTPVRPPTTASSMKDKSYVDKPRSPAPISNAPQTTKVGGLASGKGLILKSGSTDKVTLVAKPPAPPAPAKSPWAPLPPIDKASPIAMDLPPQQPGPRFTNREAMPPPKPTGQSQPPTREIAPDDFSRSSWRDSPNMASRELYNSHSGRYEPVGDRRGSFRSGGEVHSRPPAVLQRPHHNDYAPEPSPSFQTSRQGPEAPFGRRRGSSNVSGGSGYLQRIGKGYEPTPMGPPELLGTRRGSFTGSTDSPVSPRNYSPSGQHGGRLQTGHAWPNRTSPSMMHATPNYGSTPPDVRPPSGTNASTDEPSVEYQKRLMREKAEEAMKRRLEEEKREEAAKQERIRLKLAAMGPAPERRSARKDGSGKDEIATTHETTHSGQTGGIGEDGSKEGLDGLTTSSSLEANSSGSTTGSQPGVAGHPRPAGPADLKQSNPWDSSGASSTSQDRFPVWPSSGQQGLRNVWGSPNNDRGLGNGTFNPDLGRVPDSHPAAMSQTPSKGPSPIAPPSQARSTGRGQPVPTAAPAAATAPGQSYSQSRGDDYAASPGQRAYGETQKGWVNTVLHSDNAIREQQLKERVELDRRLAEQGLTYEQAQPTIKHTWRQERVTQLEPRPKGVRPASIGSKESTSAAPNGVAGPPPPPHVTSVPSAPAGSPSSILPPKGAATSSQPRPSRFFPSKDVRHGSQMPADHDRSPSPPPPTMSGHPVYDGDVAHPHVSLPRPQPIVKLPPAPVQPAATQTSTSAAAHNSKKGDSTFAWASPAPYRGASSAATTPTHLQQTSPPGHSVGGPQSHLAMPTNSTPHSQQEWQEKIYELTGRRGGPPKSPAVESASKRALDYSVRSVSATVSLPGGSGAVKDPGDVMTKPMADECFEEQEMGSLPPVCIPHKAPEAGWQPAMAPKPLPRKFLLTDATSTDIFELAAASSVICVYLPAIGHREPRAVPWSKTSTRGSYRGSGHARAAGPRPRGVRGGLRDGKRESSNPFPTETAGNSTPGSLSSTSRGRGGYRGGRPGGSEWSRRSGQASNV